MDNTPPAIAPPDPLTTQLGELARILAHDFKNLAMMAQGNAELALRDPAVPESVAEHLRNILQASQLTHQLASRISAHAHQQVEPVAVFDLLGIVEKVWALVGTENRRGHQLILETPTSPPLPLRGHASEWMQILLNLCLDAFRTMEQRRGTLTLSIHQDSQEALVRIADTGPGLNAAQLASLFDPKAHTEAGGHLAQSMGLAYARQVLGEHAVTLKVESTPGKGTSVLLRAPLAAASELPTATAPFTEAPRRKRCVLYVEDEPTMRDLGMDMLQLLHCRVTLARNGAEALELVQRNPDYFDIILSDSKMPEMSGTELARKLRERFPDLPFVLVTAFNDDATHREVQRLGITQVLGKPFMLEELQSVLEVAAPMSKPE